MEAEPSGLQLPFHALKSVRQLFEEVLDHPLVVVAPAENVVECREAMSLAALFLVIQLLRIEFVVAYHSPVVAGRIHRKTWSQRSIHPDDHGVLPCPAVPWQMG